MSRFFRNLPIQQKLVLFSVFIAGMALLLFTLASAFAQIRTMRQAMVDNLMILSESLADLSSAALSFSDSESATEILRTLHADQDVEIAVMYTPDGEVFARYSNANVAEIDNLPQPLTEKKHHFFFQDSRYKLELFQPITLEGKLRGTLYLLSNTDRMVEHLQSSVLLLLLSMIVVFTVTVIASTRLQALITRPASLLARTARNISEKGDYGVRVEKSSDDEIGQLIDDFNIMLDAIQDRDTELQQHRQNLEQLVYERTEELRTKRDEALAAARAKSEFLANMSHEIRTPMNGVIGVLSLLRDVPMDNEYRRLLETATRSADSLLLIINDILDFSKIDAGKISFESIDFDLRSLVEETSELFIDAVTLKKIDITCFIPTDLPCRIQGDPTRLRQIITNLLSNGVKFTEQGEVKLQVAMQGRNGCIQELLFTVEDTGIGIAEEATGRLFEKFTQADGSTTRKYGGTGLGLSVCKQLVERQGGKIGVRSVLGSGSTFWFSLPFIIVEDSCPMIPYTTLQGKHVMVVDDNRSNCAIVENYLRFCDVRVSICNDSQSCLDRLEVMSRSGEHLDALLLDQYLGDSDGLQLAETIHRRYGEVSPEILLMSSLSVAKDQLRKNGVAETILKPIRQSDLYNKLASIYSQERNKGVQLPGKEQETRTSPLQGKVLLVDDEPINQKIAMAILQKFGLQVDIASSGLKAVQMVEDNNYSVVLMDIQMPEMSGYEATQLIREREAHQGIKKTVIIAMTANAMESTRNRCFEMGMDDFFTKPIKPTVLAERLLPWLTRDMAVPDPASLSLFVDTTDRNDSQQQAGWAGESLWDLSTAKGFVGGDESLLRDLAKLFIERNDKLLGAIQEAIQLNDAEAIRESAHAYKGAVSHFAARQLREYAITLESMGKNGSIDGCAEVLNQLKLGASQLLKELTSYSASP